MSIGLAFFHGWGLSSTFWNRLRAALPDYPHAVIDRGYFGGTSSTPWHLADQWVAIGHSKGWADALHYPSQHHGAPEWAATVSLCGFTHFCARHADDAGQARRVVERMVKVFGKAPHEVLNDFLSRCELTDCLPTSDQALTLPALQHDLVALIDMDVSQLFESLALPHLALAAQDDVIVSPALSATTWSGTPQTELIWHPTGGHALGHAHADWCAQAIRHFVNTVNRPGHG